MKQKDLSFLTDVSQIDWARLAAFIDGEGCISIKTVKGAREFSRRVCYVEVMIANTDPRLTDWLVRVFGGSVCCAVRKNIKWSDCSRWTTASRHASALLQGCLPHFIIKREQAETALAFQRTVLPDRRYGMKGRPQELIDRQHAFKDQLSDLKGTSSKNKRTSAPTVQ